MLSAVHASPLPKSVCSITDERVKVDPDTSPPYNWICSLHITAANRDKYVGSGFKIHVPNINCSIVVTSGHCVFILGEYAHEIRVTFPGQEAVVAEKADLYASPEYIEDHNPDYDYGFIILNGNSNEGFGWSAIAPGEELLGRIVTNCGYPSDKKPWPQMWITGGKITKVTTNRLFYMNDTTGGESGSPVYTWYNGYWTVLGVHSYGSCPNSAPKFTSQMIYRFLERTQNLKKYALRSAHFTDVYVRCDGSDVTKAKDDGSGTINCQYKPPRSWETFFIFPVEVTPSIAVNQTYIVALQNYYWKNAFVRLDGRGMTKFRGSGGGVVNCQWTGIYAYNYESFNLKQERSGCYYFQSVAFPNCYIRLDGRGVTSPVGSGGGVVNCQYYDSGSGPLSYEFFFLEEQQYI